MDILDKTSCGANCKKRRADAVRMVVVHRTDVGADAEETAKWFAANPRYTRGKMPYHAVVHRDGRVEQAVALARIAPGAGVVNKVAVQVAVKGDPRKEPLSPKQAASLVKVCKDLCSWIGVVDVRGHDEIKGGRADPDKSCPGEHLNMDGLREAVREDFAAWDTDELEDRMEQAGWKVY